MPSPVVAPWRAYCGCVLFILCLLLRTAPAQAAILQVPSEYATIQAAMDAAAPGDVVQLAAGTYTGAGNKNLDFGGKDIIVRYNAFNPASCVIDCEGSGIGFNFHSGETAAAAVENITIKNASGFEGGAITITNSSPTLFNCHFIGNYAVSGGGIYIANGSPTITDCNFTGNLSESGGAICNLASSPTISKCFFIQNRATFGGGIASSGTCDPIITDSTFYGNRGDGTPQGGGQGGAMYTVGGSNPTVTRCFFTDNWATRGGGGIWTHGRSPSFIACSFTGNQSSSPGGGVQITNGTPGFTNCTFFANRGNAGGAIAAYGGNPIFTGCAFTGNLAIIGGGLYLFQSTATVINSTFTANVTSDGAGAVYLSENSSTFTNSLFVNNTATQGGGIYCIGSDPTVTNCTFSGNQARMSGGAGGGGIYSYSGNPVVANCILWGNIGGQVTGPRPPAITYSNVQGGYSGEGNLSTDPLFVRNPSPGADGNVGTGDDDFGDLHLQAGSTCLNTGSNAAVPLNVLTDLDANPRIAAGTVDRGAYEAQPALNVTAQVQVTRGGFRRNAATGRYTQTVTLKNISANAITGPLSLVLDSLSNNAALYNKTGTTSVTSPTGSPYLNSNSDLAAGASITLTLEFTNPTNAAIAYTPRVLAGAGTR